MFWWDGRRLVSFDAVEDCSSADQWCYFCNSKKHTGRQCEEQSKVIRSELLTEKIISQWSESSSGDFNEGDDPPDCQLVEPNTCETNKTNLISELHQKYNSQVNIVTIYIKEAHAADKWALYSDICYKEPTTIQERCKIALMYKEKTKAVGTILVDNMDNQCNKLYAAWPERLYIVQNRKIVYKSGIGPEGYHPETVEQWIILNNQRQNI